MNKIALYSIYDSTQSVQTGSLGKTHYCPVKAFFFFLKEFQRPLHVTL